MVDFYEYIDVLCTAVLDLVTGPKPATEVRYPSFSEYASKNTLFIPFVVLMAILLVFSISNVYQKLKWIFTGGLTKVNRATEIKLGPFKRDDNVRKWFDDFEKVMQFRDIADPKLKGRLLFTHIEPNEAAELESIFSMFDDDFPSLKQYFIEATDKTPVKHDQLRVAFQNREQQSDESIFEYFEAITGLGHKAFKDTSTKQGVRKIIKERFLNGLRDPAIRSKLSLDFDSDKTSLSTLLSEASRLDALFNGAP
jgi:hypothetical protein